MSFVKAIAAAAAIPMLMGCGAGGGTGLSFSPVGSGPISVVELELLLDQLEALPDVFDDVSISPTVPSTSSASYSGLIEAEVDFSSIALGRLDMTANFSAGTLTGVAGDFSIYDDSTETPVVIETLTGTLPITAGTITDATLSATLNGTLGAAAGDYGIASTMTGGFVDVEGQSLAAGFLSGTLTNPNATTSNLDGGFLATQN